jgi:hypothetical protein
MNSGDPKKQTMFQGLGQQRRNILPQWSNIFMTLQDIDCSP